MPPTTPLAVPLEDVPLYLASLHAKEFPWHRTPGLLHTTLTMRDLCAAVMRELPREKVLQEHCSVVAEAVFTLLKAGALTMMGKKLPENVQKEVVWRLESMQKNRREILLDNNHPFADNPGYVTQLSSTETNPMTLAKKQKKRNVLKTQAKFEDALAFLHDNPILQEFTNKRLPHMLHPDDATVINLPRNVLAQLDTNSVAEPVMRQMLLTQIMDYCMHRFSDLGERIPHLTEKYNLGSPRGEGDDDIVTLFANIQRRIWDSPQAEKDLRVLLLLPLIVLAKEAHEPLRSEGKGISVDEVLRTMTVDIWPKMLQKHKIPYTECGEAAIAALAVSARIDPLEDVRTAMLRFS